MLLLLLLVLLLLSKILSSFTLHEISPNSPQVPRSLLDQFTRLRAFLQSLQQRCNLPIIIQVRTSSTVSEVCDAAKTTMLHPGHFETTPAHGMLFTTRRTLMRRWHTFTRANAERCISVEMRGLSQGYSDSFKGPCYTIKLQHQYRRLWGVELVLPWIERLGR